MAKLIIKAPGAPVQEVELSPGVHRFGRSLNTDCHIPHPSVSGAHCELTIDSTGAAIKDLGSTNGTWVNGQRVEQSTLASGQSARLGEVEIVFDPVPDGAGPGLRIAPSAPAEPHPPVPQPAVARLVVPVRSRRETNFFKTVPGAFVYPLRKNGFIILVGGTLFFGILDAAVSFRVLGLLVVGFFLGFFMTTFIFGYIFEYMQSIITSTALGESQIPDWPPYEGWWDSAVAPFFRWIGILLVCSAPASIATHHFGESNLWIPALLFLCGVCYYPMALLSVAMHDTILAVNPIIVIAAITRVPVEYLVTCIVFACLSGILLLSPVWFTVLQLPIIGVILSQGLFLYFSSVEMRLVGLLYYTQRHRIGWKY